MKDLHKLVPVYTDWKKSKEDFDFYQKKDEKQK